MSIPVVAGIAAESLAQYVARIERLQAEIDERNADKSEVYKQAKGAGFDVKILRKLIAERAKDPSKLSEEEQLLEMYRAALGM